MKALRVAAGLIRHGDLWLVARRGPGMKMPGYWEFPGGKIEPGESPEAALVREIKEELDLTVTPTKVLGEFPFEYDFGKISLIAIIATSATMDLSLREHESARWLKMDQIRGLNLAPADEPILRFVLAQERSSGLK